MNFSLRNPFFVFGLVFLWRLALLIFTAQPIPANDAFFFDGPAVNSVLHGRFANPSVIYYTPFSATNIFCAYPPLYPLTLRAWMGVAGTSVLSAMWFHLLIFGVYLFLLAAIFRRLQTPAWCVNLAGLFLLAMTFDDRPDSLAQVFGLLAFWLWLDIEKRRRSAWLPAVLVTLSLWTNPEIGALYFGLVTALTLLRSGFCGRQWPVLPLLLLLVLPPLSILAFKTWQPELWTGFLEHARQTPSFTHLRDPSLNDLLKVIRAIPGALLVMAVLPWHWRRENWSQPQFQLAVVCSLASLAVTVGALTAFTADWINFARYLQPLAVGGFLAWRFAASDSAAPAPGLRCWQGAFRALALLAAVRAIGLSTWGVACAADVSYPAALQLVRSNLNSLPAGTTVVASSAFLYESARHSDLVWLHDDWLHPASTGVSDEECDRQAMVAIKPARMILVQYDFYRRFQGPLQWLQAHPELVEVTIRNYAKVTPPDASKSLQRVLQHIAWAPVIVDFKWK